MPCKQPETRSQQKSTDVHAHHPSFLQTVSFGVSPIACSAAMGCLHMQHSLAHATQPSPCYTVFDQFPVRNTFHTGSFSCLHVSYIEVHIVHQVFVMFMNGALLCITTCLICSSMLIFFFLCASMSYTQTTHQCAIRLLTHSAKQYVMHTCTTDLCNV